MHAKYVAVCMALCAVVVMFRSSFADVQAGRLPDFLTIECWGLLACAVCKLLGMEVMFCISSKCTRWMRACLPEVQAGRAPCRVAGDVFRLGTRQKRASMAFQGLLFSC
jgi:hypothetical protein